MSEKMKVLIAEDFDLTFDLLRVSLERSGFQVLRASTTLKALDLARTEHPDLILLDVQLQDGNGFTVARELKRRAETDQIPVIALSGMDPYDLRHQAAAARCDNYLAKPFKMADLAWRIHRALTGRSEPVASAQ